MDPRDVRREIQQRWLKSLSWRGDALRIESCYLHGKKVVARDGQPLLANNAGDAGDETRALHWRCHSGIITTTTSARNIIGLLMTRIYEPPHGNHIRHEQLRAAPRIVLAAWDSWSREDTSDAMTAFFVSCERDLAMCSVAADSEDTLMRDLGDGVLDPRNFHPCPTPALQQFIAIAIVGTLWTKRLQGPQAHVRTVLKWMEDQREEAARIREAKEELREAEARCAYMEAQSAPASPTAELRARRAWTERTRRSLLNNADESCLSPAWARMGQMWTEEELATMLRSCLDYCGDPSCPGWVDAPATQNPFYRVAWRDSAVAVWALRYIWWENGEPMSYAQVLTRLSPECIARDRVVTRRRKAALKVSFAQLKEWVGQTTWLKRKLADGVGVEFTGAKGEQLRGAVRRYEAHGEAVFARALYTDDDEYILPEAIRGRGMCEYYVRVLNNKRRTAIAEWLTTYCQTVRDVKYLRPETHVYVNGVGAEHGIYRRLVEQTTRHRNEMRIPSPFDVPLCAACQQQLGKGCLYPLMTLRRDGALQFSDIRHPGCLLRERRRGGRGYVGDSVLDGCVINFTGDEGIECSEAAVARSVASRRDQYDGNYVRPMNASRRHHLSAGIPSTQTASPFPPAWAPSADDEVGWDEMSNTKCWGQEKIIHGRRLGGGPATSMSVLWRYLTAVRYGGGAVNEAGGGALAARFGVPSQETVCLALYSYYMQHDMAMVDKPAIAALVAEFACTDPQWPLRLCERVRALHGADLEPFIYP